MVLELHQELADKQHQDKRRKHYGKSSRHTAQYRPTMPVTGIGHTGIAYIRSRVDTNRSRRHLADSHDIRKLPARQPMITVDHFPLNQGNHGIASPKTEQADFEETIEKLYI